MCKAYVVSNRRLPKRLPFSDVIFREEGSGGARAHTQLDLFVSFASFKGMLLARPVFLFKSRQQPAKRGDTQAFPTGMRAVRTVQTINSATINLARFFISLQPCGFLPLRLPIPAHPPTHLPSTSGSISFFLFSPTSLSLSQPPPSLPLHCRQATAPHESHPQEPYTFAPAYPRRQTQPRSSARSLTREGGRSVCLSPSPRQATIIMVLAKLRRKEKEGRKRGRKGEWTRVRIVSSPPRVHTFPTTMIRFPTAVAAAAAASQHDHNVHNCIRQYTHVYPPHTHTHVFPG